MADRPWPPILAGSRSGSPRVSYHPGRPGRTIDATVRYLNRRGVRSARHVGWVIRFGDDRSYAIRFDGARWSRQRGAAPADVTVQTSPAELVKFLSADPEGRHRWLRQWRAAGTGQRLDEFARAFRGRTGDVTRAKLKSTLR